MTTQQLTDKELLTYINAHPEIAKNLKNKAKAEQTKQQGQATLESKRPYFSYTRTMLKQALDKIAKDKGLIFKPLSKTEYAFINPKNKKITTFCFANGKDYTIDPKDKHDLSKYQAKSWHVLDKALLEKQNADYFVFFISRRLDHKMWMITFTYQELLDMLAIQNNFYFGITKDNQLIENRLQKEKQLDSKHIGLNLLLADLK